jgi:hypothetical protein
VDQIQKGVVEPTKARNAEVQSEIDGRGAAPYQMGCRAGSQAGGSKDCLKKQVIVEA